MNKIKTFLGKIKVYGGMRNLIYTKFEHTCRSKAWAIYYDKFNMAMDHNISLNWAQDRLMWAESMDTVLNRPVNKIILKFLEAWDK